MQPPHCWGGYCAIQGSARFEGKVILQQAMALSNEV
jgi:hypothetical protein